jgi:hypothetical protein
MRKPKKFKWEYLVYILIGLIILGLVLFAGALAMGKLNFNVMLPGIFTQDTISLTPEKVLAAYSVNLYLTKTTICVGDTTKGVIDSNIPYGVCSIWMDTGTGWQQYDNVKLDGEGDFSQDKTVNAVGTVMFRTACCDSESNCKVSNVASLTVNACGANPPPTGPTCTDSDGGINWEVSGFCEDSTTQTGHADGCHGDTATDWYCNSDHLCVSATKTCNYPLEVCGNGICQTFPCESIFNPPAMETCASGTCPTGYSCNWVMAGTQMPAKCLCQPIVD